MSDRSSSSPERYISPSPVAKRTRLNCRNFYAWVEVGGEECPVYSVSTERKKESKETIVTGYIVSAAGETFSVHWKDSKRNFSSSGTLRIDGFNVSKKRIYTDKVAGDLNVKATDKECISSIRTSEEYRQGLTFTDVKTTDDDAYLDRASTATLGEIMLQVNQCIRRETYKQSKNGPKKETVFNVPQIDGVLHETQAKASGHCFQLGPRIHRPLEERPSSKEGLTLKKSGPKSRMPQKRVWKWENKPNSIIFRFLYRSEARLIADGIIPQHSIAINSEVDPISIDHTPPLESIQSPVFQHRRITQESFNNTGFRSRSPSLPLVHVDDPVLKAPSDSPPVPDRESSVSADRHQPVRAGRLGSKPGMTHDTVDSGAGVKTEEDTVVDNEYAHILSLRAQLDSATRKYEKKNQVKKEVKLENLNPVGLMTGSSGCLIDLTVDSD